MKAEEKYRLINDKLIFFQLDEVLLGKFSKTLQYSKKPFSFITILKYLLTSNRRATVSTGEDRHS